eukprot:UN28911
MSITGGGYESMNGIYGAETMVNTGRYTYKNTEGWYCKWEENKWKLENTADPATKIYSVDETADSQYFPPEETTWLGENESSVQITVVCEDSHFTTTTPEPTKCDELSPVDNSSVAYTNEVDYLIVGTVCTMTCNDKWAGGSAEYTCNDSGEWDGDANFKCVEAQLGYAQITLYVMMENVALEIFDSAIPEYEAVLLTMLDIAFAELESTSEDPDSQNNGLNIVTVLNIMPGNQNTVINSLDDANFNVNLQNNLHA